MNLKFIPLLAFILIMFTIAGCNSINGTKADAQEKLKGSSPNIIIILADDLGYADVGFNGSKDIITPNIDRIADEGIKFTNAYVTAAICGPSRAGLITGRYQDRFGFGRNPLFAPNDISEGLPLNEETLADALAKASYKSIAIGKWHLGAHPSQHPLERGFDDFFGFLTGGHQYFPERWTLENEFEVEHQYDAYRIKLMRDHKRVEENEYLTDALSREAVNYIEKYKDQPFFMYLAYNAPHTPLQATDEYLDRFPNIKDQKRRTYAAMVSAMDDGVGQILAKLEETGIENNTLIFFLSDNGGPERANSSNNGALRGGKSTLYEGGVRVPFAMKWPNKIPKGKISHFPVISLDIFATAIAQSAIPIQLENSIDGINLLPYINDDSDDKIERTFFWRKFDAETRAVRNGKIKLYDGPKQKALFNLTKDMSETNNLISQKPEIYESLNSLYEEWEAQMIDPVFMGLGNYKEYNRLHPNRFKRLN